MSAPTLRTDLVFVEQSYRGEQTYIVKDPTNHKYFRFRPIEAMVMQSLDGRSVEESSAGLAEQGLKIGPAALEKFAGKLKAMGLCERSLEERSIMLMERLRADRRQRLKPPLFKGNILRIRWSVGDPDELLNRWVPRFGFLFTRPGVIAAAVTFALYFVVLVVKWPEYVGALHRLFSFDLGTVGLMYVAFMFVAAIHELGHGFACKHFGGQVHEIGAMLLYFDLAFFCNVNDAWGFPERRARLWVTAAGSWIQLILASIAGIVWWAVPPGSFVSEFAMATFVVAGILTVIFNLNPLLPLDGYFALMDVLEVPNLRPRAFAYLGWVIKHRLLGMDAAEPPVDEREQRIFLWYGVLAAIYTGFILYAFAGILYGWLDRALGALGILLFGLGLWLMLRGPIREYGSAAMLAARRQVARFRGQRVQRVGMAVAAIVLLGLVVPWPVTVTGRFAAAPALSIALVAPEDGIVDRVLVREGTRVRVGAPLVEIRNLTLERQAAASQRSTDSLASREMQARALGRGDDIGRLEAERLAEATRLSGMRAALASLRLRAVWDGVVMTARPEELAGRWVEAGDRVLEVGQPDSVELRVALEGAGASQVQAGQPVELIPYADPGTPIRTRVGTVAAAGSGGSVHARVRVAGGGWLRPGMTGEASVTLRRSNVWGALWWTIRRRIRTDILL
jgi:putative peptide zinc metalloprotease protein